MLVKVRGGYEFPYRNTLYKGGDVIDMEEGDYRGLSHLFDVVKTVVKEPVVEATPEPEVTAEAVMDTVAHRAIVKPARSRSKK